MSNSALKAELAKRAKAVVEAKSFSFDQFSFAKQKEFFRGTANRFKVAVCSRRAGKTIGIAGDVLDLCLNNPKVRVLYVTLTRENCLEIIWPDLMDMIERYKINCKVNHQRLSVTFPNKSYFSCAGAKDKKEISKFRGRKLRRIYIDEAQNFPMYLKGMIEDDLMPTLRDLRGEMYVTGTPGPLKRGFFYDISSNGRWESHNWTAFENPHLHNPPEKDYEATLEEERQVRGIDKSDPSYVRETYGIWTEDRDSLVFKFSEAKNVAPAPEGKLTYVFGIDLGYNDADAIAVLGYSHTDSHVYLVEELVTEKQGITPLMHQIDKLVAKYSPVKMVIDSGGLGKKIQEELRPRYSINLDAADKNRKFEFIELLNDDLRTGKLKAIKGSRFEQDCYLVQWDRNNPDPTKLKISNDFHSDMCFIAGTMVETSRGKVPIERLRVDDLIYTRQGFKQLDWAAQTGKNKEVVKLTFNDGNTLICTKNHPIYTHNRGFVNAENLTIWDRCSNIWEWDLINKNTSLEKQSDSTEWNFIDTLIRLGNILNPILAAIGGLKKLCYIGPFGNIIMDLFQNATSFIIKTTIRPIMTFQTWSAYLMKNTLANIGFRLCKKIGEKWENWVKRLQKLGIKLQKVSPSIRNLGKCGKKKIAFWLKKFVLSAMKFIIKTILTKLQSMYVRQNASQSDGEIPVLMTRQESVCGNLARSLIPQINTENKNSVVALVTREVLTKKENVYGLKVKDCPEYFANNILVHNCDAVLYAWRECKHYFQEPLKTRKPSRNSDEYMLQLEQREADALQQKKEAQQNSDFTDVTTFADMGIEDSPEDF